MLELMPENWRDALDNHVGRVNWRNVIAGIDAFLQNESGEQHAYQPVGQNIFTAFEATRFDRVRVVIIGQDPYPEEANATGIAFFANGNSTPSLRSIYKTMELDGIRGANLTNACLKRWAEEEHVLLLNSALTLRRVDGINMHREPWKCFIQAVVEALSNSDRTIYFMLWGKDAHAFEYYIQTGQCPIYKAHHPVAHSSKGDMNFKNCRHFSAVNTEIARREGEEPINWIRDIPPPPPQAQND